MGGESLSIPAVMGLLFTFLILGLLWCALSLLRSRTQGYLAAMVLMGTPFFIAMGASQFADIPFAFFILATLVMLFFQARSPGNHAGPLILAGIAAGLCAWTKNEGLLFVLIVTVSLFGTAAYTGGWRRSLNRTGWFLAGALPVLLIVIYFKTRLSPANDLVAGFSLAAVSAKLLGSGPLCRDRQSLFHHRDQFHPGVDRRARGDASQPRRRQHPALVGYLLLAGIRIDGRDRIGLFQTAAVLLLMLVGYFFVYVLTPLDLNYHLMTSLNRLFLQLWPGVIFLFFMIAGLAGAGSSRGTGRKPHPHSRKQDRTREKNQGNQGDEMNTEKMLSVVIPVYNEKETILKIIEKVLKLDFVKEIIVVDDGSTDGTRELLEQATLRRAGEALLSRPEPGQGGGAADRIRSCHRGDRGRSRTRTWNTIRTNSPR